MSFWDSLKIFMQTAKVVVVAVERERKQLRFSEKLAEGEGQELAQKRAQLMVSLHCALFCVSQYFFLLVYERAVSFLTMWT